MTNQPRYSCVLIVVTCVCKYGGILQLMTILPCLLNHKQTHVTCIPLGPHKQNKDIQTLHEYRTFTKSMTVAEP